MKTKFFLITTIFILVLLATGVILLTQSEKNKISTICEKPYTIKCYDYESLPQKLIKEKIPCSTDKDCLNLSDFCAPGIPSLADCIGFDIFCGEDNTCKGCCPKAGS